MTKETQDLQDKIRAQRGKDPQPTPTPGASGFGVAMAMMMDMVCCLLVGLGIGLLVQKMWNTSPVVIAGFGLLGGIAGLFSVVQMGLHRGQK
ncbi:MAG: hypothetical protein J6Y85_02100 [Alphaproteobacteria bacterium]|nr:hypothetical protein [Alphaproteobacteria bacterium]